MKPASEIILDLIDNDSPDWTATENAFFGAEPDEPINCLTLFDYESWVQDPKLNYDMDHVQVRIRDASYKSAWTKINNIKLLLNGISPFNSGDDEVGGIWIQVPPMPVGRDAKGHHIFTMTLRVLIVRFEKGNRQ